MTDTKQLTLFRATTAGFIWQVEYEPPPADVIDAFACAVCQQEGQGSPSTTQNTEEVCGFATFLKVVAHSVAKHLNEGGTL